MSPRASRIPNRNRLEQTEVRASREQGVLEAPIEGTKALHNADLGTPAQTSPTPLAARFSASLRDKPD